jgi:hypothetical protein
MYRTPSREVGPRRAARTATGFAAAATLGFATALLVPGGPPGAGSTAAAEPAVLSVAVRAGQPAPGPGRFAAGFHCDLAAGPDGGLLFADAAESTLLLRDADGLRPLAWAGQPVGASALARVCHAAAGAGGAFVAQGTIEGQRQGLFRIGSDGIEPLLLSGQGVETAGGTRTVGFLLGHAVDGTGALIASVGFSEGGAALLRVAIGEDPVILLRDGDPVGPARIAALPIARPAPGAPGSVLAVAALDSGHQAIVLVRPGNAPVPLFMVAAAPPFAGGIAAGPAANGAGDAAFVWSDRGTLYLQGIAGGMSRIIAGPGTPIATGGALAGVRGVDPLLAASGEIYFAADRAGGGAGWFRAGSEGVRPVAEPGMGAGDAGALQEVVSPAQPRPALAAGTGGPRLFFHATATGATGLFSAGAGTIGAEVAVGDPLPATFASFMDPRVQYLGGGPALAPGGGMLFDARVSGGERGLFVRERSGVLSRLAIGGEPGPGGGAWQGQIFSFHSINESGGFAFLGSTLDGASRIRLYVGDREGGPVLVADVGPLVLRAGGPASAAYLPVPPPSRINRSGQVAVPILRDDGSEALSCWDGGLLIPVVAPGDPARGGGSFATLFTGSPFTGLRVPPLLDDGGGIVFGAATTTGDTALFRAWCVPGGGGLPERLFGAEEPVEDGFLAPFDYRVLDGDPGGKLALQAIHSQDFDFADFLRGPAGGTVTLARRFGPAGGLGAVSAVTPRLTLTGDGGAVYGVQPFGGGEGLLRLGPEPGTEPIVLAAREMEAPGGGLFLDFQADGGRGGPARSTVRLASDGRGVVAFAASTTGGPEAIYLHGIPAKRPPIAVAGGARQAECLAHEGTRVTLDGSASSDPDGDPLSYEWSGPFGTAGGVAPEVLVPPGTHIISLVVSDGVDRSEPATFELAVRDTIPPAAVATASPDLLWPPDGRMVPVAVSLGIADACDPAPAVALLSIASSEPEGSGRPGEDVSEADFGEDDRLVSLRAERRGGGAAGEPGAGEPGAGRTYTLSWRITDAAGNAAVVSVPVTVPHDRRP